MTDTTNRAQDALAEAKKGAGDLKVLAGEKAGALASKAGEKAGDIASKAGEKAGDLAAKAGDKASDLAGKAGELAGKARSNMPAEVRETADKVVTETKNRPWAVAAVAAGVLVLWRVLRRKKRS